MVLVFRYIQKGLGDCGFPTKCFRCPEVRFCVILFINQSIPFESNNYSCIYFVFSWCSPLQEGPFIHEHCMHTCQNIEGQIFLNHECTATFYYDGSFYVLSSSSLWHQKRKQYKPWDPSNRKHFLWYSQYLKPHEREERQAPPEHAEQEFLKVAKYNAATVMDLRQRNWLTEWKLSMHGGRNIIKSANRTSCDENVGANHGDASKMHTSKN